MLIAEVLAVNGLSGNIKKVFKQLQFNRSAYHIKICQF